MKRSKQHIALLLCLCFLSVSLFSHVYIAVEADHDCIDDHCPICTCINHAEQTLRQLDTGITGSSIVISPFIILSAAFVLMLPVFLCPTPVSQKTRMNN